MNEEEIIAYLESYIQFYSVVKAPEPQEARMMKAVREIIDLYNKEKEKNIKAGELLGKRINMCNQFQIELEKEKEKNKKVKKFCKEKSTFQTFGDEDMQYVLETYVNRLKHRILDLLED